MSFKLKSKGELFGYNEELSEFGTPVFEKDLGPNILAEANRDGTIFIDKNIPENKKQEAVDHEKTHKDQMQQNRLDYTDTTVTWKKDTKSPARVYKRVGGALFSPAGKKLIEGDSSLEWEKEAYKKQ